MGAGAGFGADFDVGAFEDFDEESNGGFDEGMKKVSAEEKLLASVS